MHNCLRISSTSDDIYVYASVSGKKLSTYLKAKSTESTSWIRFCRGRILSSVAILTSSPHNGALLDGSLGGEEGKSWFT